MTADQFLDQLEQSGLLDLVEMADVRQQAAATMARRSAAEVADWLVGKGLLTRGQATRLLKDAPAGRAPTAAAGTPTRPTAGPKAPARPAPVPPKKPPADDELGLAPLDDEPQELQLTPVPENRSVQEEVVLLESVDQPPAPPRPAARPTPPNVPPAGTAGLIPLDALPGLQPLDAASGLQPLDVTPGLQPLGATPGLQPLGATPGLQPLGAASLQPLDPRGGLQPLDRLGGLQPLDAGGLTPLAGPRGRTAGLEPLSPAPPAPEQALQSARQKLKKSQWDTGLLYIGGGALILLVIAAVVLFVATRGKTAEQVFQEAEEQYKAEAYADAIAQLERFVAKYPTDPNASLARVKIGFARLWQANKGTDDKQEALRLAQEVLPGVENETAFPDARSELAAILPEIAEGLATRAAEQPQAAQTQELVDLADEAMKLVNSTSYIPQSARKAIENRVGIIQGNIDKARRGIMGHGRLTETVAAMQKAVADGRPPEAHDQRRRLLREYPELEQQPELVAAVQAVAAAERTVVKVEEQAVAAQTQDHPLSAQFRIAIASRRGGEAGDDPRVAGILARGAVYGLQVSSGRLLWRRFVGHETGTQPLPVSLQPASDLLVVDGRRNELLRLKAATGTLVWRLRPGRSPSALPLGPESKPDSSHTPDNNLGEPFSGPVVHGARLLVTTASGRILAVNADTGAVVRQALFPQPLAVSPAVGRAPVLYQAGEHSHLYVLDDDTLQCQEVYYLGHKGGTIAVPPALVPGAVLVAENSGDDFCNLHVLATGDNGLGLKPALPPFRLKGRVLSPLCVAGNRAVVVTDRGEVRVFEANPADPQKLVVAVGEPVAASMASPQTGYAVFEAGRLWVAHDRLIRFDLPASTNRLTQRSVEFEQDVFVAAPRVYGDALIHLRRRHRSPAYTVTAANVNDGRRLWEVDLAVPAVLLAGDAEKKQLELLSAQAELFAVPADIIKAGRWDQPAAAAAEAARTAAFTEAVPLGDGRYALASPYDRSRLVLFDPHAASPAGRLKAVTLAAIGGAQVTAAPVALGGGLLLPLDNGQVVLLDAATGANRAAPFQPRVAAGEKVRWQRPALLGTGAACVLADNRRKLYRLTVQDQPQPLLGLQKEAPVEGDVTAPLAAAGDTVYAVVRAESGDLVKSFTAAELTADKEWPLEGRVAWGPERVGARVLVASDRGQLFCFASGSTHCWTIPLPYGPLSGTPFAQDQDIVLAALNGTVWRAAGADGKELGRLELGEPVAVGPVPFGGLWLASGSDGTVYGLTLAERGTPPAGTGGQ